MNHLDCSKALSTYIFGAGYGGSLLRYMDAGSVLSDRNSESADGHNVSVKWGEYHQLSCSVG